MSNEKITEILCNIIANQTLLEEHKDLVEDFKLQEIAEDIAVALIESQHSLENDKRDEFMSVAVGVIVDKHIPEKYSDCKALQYLLGFAITVAQNAILVKDGNPKLVSFFDEESKKLRIAFL